MLSVVIFVTMQFKDIIGHLTIKQRLIQSVKTNRISHAQLFSGRPGTGALALALAYSQYITCENRLDTDSCGICPSCLKSAKMVHPDIHFSYPVAGKDKPKSIDFIVKWREAVLENPYLETSDWYEYIDIETKQGFLSVEEAADLLKKLSLKSFESEYKITIIWLPEKMRTETANKMLKIIEEPPDKTLFLLVTENYEQILPTILSRTQLLKTGRIADHDLMETLQNRHGVTKELARQAVQLSDGNLNMALAIVNTENREGHGEKQFIEWMRICYRPLDDYAALLEKMEKFVKLTREEQKNYFLFCLNTIRECLILNINISTLLRSDENGQKELQRFSVLINTHNVYQLEKEFNKAYFHTERNANAKILFLDLSFKIHRLLIIKKPDPVATELKMQG